MCTFEGRTGTLYSWISSAHDTWLSLYLIKPDKPAHKWNAFTLYQSWVSVELSFRAGGEVWMCKPWMLRCLQRRPYTQLSVRRVRAQLTPLGFNSFVILQPLVDVCFSARSLLCCSPNFLVNFVSFGTVGRLWGEPHYGKCWGHCQVICRHANIHGTRDIAADAVRCIHIWHLVAWPSYLRDLHTRAHVQT